MGGVVMMTERMMNESFWDGVGKMEITATTINRLVMTRGTLEWGCEGGRHLFFACQSSLDSYIVSSWDVRPPTREYCVEDDRQAQLPLSRRIMYRCFGSNEVSND